MRNFQLNCSKFSSKAVSSHTGFRHRNFHARSAYFCGGVGCKPGTVCVFAINIHIHIHIPMKHLLYGIRYDKAYKVGYFEDLVGYPKQYSFPWHISFLRPFPIVTSQISHHWRQIDGARYISPYLSIVRWLSLNHQRLPIGRSFPLLAFRPSDWSGGRRNQFPVYVYVPQLEEGVAVS